MKWKFLFVLSAFFFCGNAAHIIGGEITYRCIEEGKYEFTMILYRDCNENGALFDSDTGAPFPATITIYQGSELFQILELDAPIIEDVSMINQVEGIKSPISACIEKGTYRFEVNLSKNTEYNIAYQRCCYIGTIANVFEPGLTGVTIATQIPSAPICNSSPVFSKNPQYFLSPQFPFTIDLSTTDLDGDSLAYELCSPLIGGGPNTANFDAPSGVAPNPDTNLPYDSVIFATGFDSQNPFPSEPQLTINDTTGILTGNVTVLGNFMMAVCVKEFRDGNLIGTTRRQFQINVSNEVVSTQKELLENVVTLYPNPSEEYISIIASNDLIIDSYSLIDIEGRIVEQQNFKDHPIQIANLPNGLYFVVLNTSKGRIIKKLVKQ